MGRSLCNGEAETPSQSGNLQKARDRIRGAVGTAVSPRYCFVRVQVRSAGKNDRAGEGNQAGWRAFENEKGTVGFLAFINYLREFYDPRLLTRCGRTLRAYVRKGGKSFSEFEADEEAQKCVRELREGLRRHRLKPYSGARDLIVMAHASDYGVGEVAFGPPA